MKFLIFTVTVGAGHNEVARNVAEYLKSQGHEVLVHDMFKHKKFRQWVISKLGFGAMVKFPTIANYFYDRTKKSDNSIYDNYIKSIKEETLELVNTFKPDVIISSHIAGRLFVKKYESEFVKPVLNYFIVTDYDLTPGLKDYKENEYVIIPNEDFKDELVEKGFAPDHILPFGIPVNAKYYKKLDENEAKEKLGIDIDLNKKIVLVVGGGNGLGNVYKVIKELSKHDDIQIISVAGRNEDLKEEIDALAKKSKAKIYSYGFTKELEYMMTIADYLVGKTGGITATEAITKGVPLIAVGKTPKPEYSNLQYLKKNGMAIEIDDIKTIYDKIKTLDTDAMKEKYEKSKKVGVVEKINEKILERR